MKQTVQVTARGKGTWGKPRGVQLATITTTRWSSNRARSHTTTSYSIIFSDSTVGERSFASEVDRDAFLASSFADLELVDVVPAEEHDRVHPLSELVGNELAAVYFVRDYVQLQFEPPINLYVWPRIHHRGAISRHGDPGYNDALISAIDTHLTAVDEVLDLGLVLDLEGDVRLTVPLDGTDLIGPEIAAFTGKAGWFVWRPGDEIVEWLPSP